MHYLRFIPPYYQVVTKPKFLFHTYFGLSLNITEFQHASVNSSHAVLAYFYRAIEHSNYVVWQYIATPPYLLPYNYARLVANTYPQHMLRLQIPTYSSKYPSLRICYCSKYAILVADTYHRHLLP